MAYGQNSGALILAGLLGAEKLRENVNQKQQQEGNQQKQAWSTLSQQVKTAKPDATFEQILQLGQAQGLNPRYAMALNMPSASPTTIAPQVNALQNMGWIPQGATPGKPQNVGSTPMDMIGQIAQWNTAQTQQQSLQTMLPQLVNLYKESGPNAVAGTLRATGVPEQHIQSIVDGLANVPFSVQDREGKIEATVQHYDDMAQHYDDMADHWQSQVDNLNSKLDLATKQYEEKVKVDGQRHEEDEQKIKILGGQLAVAQKKFAQSVAHQARQDAIAATRAGSSVTNAGANKERADKYKSGKSGGYKPLAASMRNHLIGIAYYKQSPGDFGKAPKYTAEQIADARSQIDSDNAARSGGQASAGSSVSSKISAAMRNPKLREKIVRARKNGYSDKDIAESL